MELFLGYLVVINIIGFMAMGIDKAKAQRHKWRIPEKSLFAIAILGGSLGTCAGMGVFRHKTKHWYFVIGMPGIFLLEAVVLIMYMMR